MPPGVSSQAGSPRSQLASHSAPSACLRAEVESVQAIDLPAGRGLRHAVRLRPLAPCPATYPRPVGVALKAPLGGEAEPRSGRDQSA